MARHIPEPQETQETQDAKPELKESQPKEPKEPMDAGPNLLICCGFNLFEVANSVKVALGIRVCQKTTER